MKKKTLPQGLHKSTQAIHAGGLSLSVYGEVSPPIFQSATFSFASAEEGALRFSGEEGYIYTRLGNPTVEALEENIGALEKGAYAMATATGMAAVTTVLLTLLDANSHLVASNALYGASTVVLGRDFSRFGVRTSFVETSSLERVETAMQPDTRLLFVETPSNPTMEITDLRGAASVAHRHDALLVVDNTFASPYLQRPLDHGADVVLHSCTKFINGHSDVVGGVIVTRREDLHKRLRSVLNSFGGTMDPHQAWLILRGVRTLPLRVERAQKNAMELAGFLKAHPKVSWVRYPGLPEHPQHELARRQMDGFGAMLSFGVKGGLEGGRTLMDNVRLITLAVSLGGVESLIEHPATMTHASVPREEREKSGLTDDLVRLSVGCEDAEDLKKDLGEALKSIPVEA